MLSLIYNKTSKAVFLSYKQSTVKKKILGHKENKIPPSH